MPLIALVSLLFFQVLLIFVHLTVYTTLAAAFGIGGPGWIAVFVVLAFTFFSASVLSRFFNNRVVVWYYAFSAYWFGLVHFLFLGGVAFYGVVTVSSFFNFYPSLPLLGAICFGAAFLVHTYGTWNSGRVEVTKIKVAFPDLPPQWKGRKVVFMTDIHLGNVHGVRFAAKVARRVAALAPWALFIGGDLYDGTMCDEEAIIAPLRALTPRIPGGTYFVSGNHEYYLRNGEVGKAFAAIQGAGIRILHNEKIDLDGIQLAGVDDKSVSGKDGLRNVLDGMTIDASVPSILLRHVPLDLAVAAEKGFFLALFGHTHRGQIFPLNFFTRRMYKGHDYGHKKHREMQTYTSSGAGSWGPPLRVGTKSEIVEVEFS